MSSAAVNPGCEKSPSLPTESEGSPLKPDIACDSNLPVEDALGPISYRGDENPGSPSSSEGSFQVPGRLGDIKPCDFITDEMLAEEKRLHSKSVEEEEKRKKDQVTDYQQMAQETREQRFERLKHLLNKSTLYTQYLVDRIKKQKEDEEKRRERVMKRKAKKEQQEKEKLLQSSHETRTVSKRKAEEITDSNTSPTQSVSKKAKAEVTPKSSPSSNLKSAEEGQDDKAESESDSKKPKSEVTPKTSSSPNLKSTNEGLDDKAEPESESGGKDEEAPLPLVDPINPDESDVVEPTLTEKAATFGVEEEDEERYTADGELIPFLQPKLMDGGVLRPYQVEGYSWLKVLYENGVNGILADEMGLGKTVQCVAMLAHLVYMGVPGPYLVCAPLSTIPNWFSEFKRFAPHVPTILYHGDREKRANLAKTIRRRHKIRDKVYVQPVVITSYEIAMIDRRYLGNHDWKYLIVDEGHRIKNTHCRLIRELRMYRSTNRLLLTGTPLQNNLAELWSLLNFLLPEIFDDLGSFEAWFDATSMNDTEKSEQLVHQERSENVLGMLHQILTPFMLRRLKTDVDLKIPPKKEVLVYAPLTQVQREMYSALVNKSIMGYLNKENEKKETVELSKTGRPKRKSTSRSVDYSLLMETDKEEKARREGGKTRWRSLEAEEKELESWFQAVEVSQSSRTEVQTKQRSSQVTVQLRNILMQLRKCCNHPYLIEHPLDPKTGDLALTEGVREAAGKMVLLDHMLPELKKRGHRVLIFSQMTRMLDLIEDYCQLREYGFCRLDGSTRMEDRRDNMSEFNENQSDKFIFLLSTRAGGLGINLVGADTVIIYDSDWNPQCDLQAQDRCHRIGQTKPVVVYRFVTANTIDQKIIERAAAKRKLEKIVIHKGSFKTGNFTAQAKSISAEELQDLLNSKDHDSEMKGDKFNISKAEMDMLMDRSDLYEKWGKKEKGNKDASSPSNDSTLTLSKKTARSSRKGKQSTKSSAKSKSQKTQSCLFEIVTNDAESIASCDTESNAGSESQTL